MEYYQTKYKLKDGPCKGQIVTITEREISERFIRVLKEEPLTYICENEFYINSHEYITCYDYKVKEYYMDGRHHHQIVVEYK